MLIIKPPAVSHIISFAVSGLAGILAIVLDESVGFSLGVIFVVFGGVWWLGRKLQSLEDGLARAQEWRDEVKQHLDRNDAMRKELFDYVKRNKDKDKGDTDIIRRHP